MLENLRKVLCVMSIRLKLCENPIEQTLMILLGRRVERNQTVLSTRPQGSFFLFSRLPDKMYPDGVRHAPGVSRYLPNKSGKPERRWDIRGFVCRIRRED